jgi:hypothetical protein
MPGLLLLSAEREIKMPGQVFIAEPAITRLAIGFAEQPTITSTANGDPALMNGGVMPLTQQHQILEVGAAAQNPGEHMVGFQMPGLVAAGVRHIPSRISNARRNALLTSRRVRPSASTLPCWSTTAPNSGLSQACLCAVAASIAPTPVMWHTRPQTAGRSRGYVPGQVVG